tara:strand:+ start:1883 stop:2347 length:465 start_codon:yes stop_codon:yes gene_type:complete
MTKKSVDEKLSTALNMDYEKPKTEETKKQIKQYEPELNTDYVDVRQNLKYIIDSGQTAIDGILRVASEGESPRAYEVVSQLIKSVSEANKDLIDLHKKIKDIKREDPDSQSANSITNNTLFVGSTKELQDMVKQNYKQIQHEIIDAEVINGEQE